MNPLFSYLNSSFMKFLFVYFSCFIFSFHWLIAQKTNPNQLDSELFSGIKFRSIGPAFMSGRIADIAIHPKNENVWYVAAGSGGVWKTENAGTTWLPIFENEASYSIGCIAIDQNNPNIIWVGTGENHGGRHIGYGDGIYKSEDGGASWKNMGLTNSEHLSKIIIHPSNSNIVWVAAQGPLWKSGGDRGIYKSEDGGKNWTHTLSLDEWTGATDLILDHSNSKTLYAASWQRHRTVAGYMGGGKGTAIYKSVDEGITWTKLTNGLPSSNLGKIGLAQSPQKPNVLYAAIELDRRTGAFYRSDNYGASWTKMSDAISGGTGPHYYQELFPCPHEFDRIYFADNYMQVSEDGGKTFIRMKESTKHVDNHAVAFKKSDPNYILIGTDGGLYESYDRTLNWKFVGNLPLTQFYKVAVDDALPFYNVYGGTQDNNTQGGPSRTDNSHGIRNSDWFVVLGGDGHQPATEPGNPNIVYAQWQQGNLARHDRTTGENINIQPQPDLGEPTERFNWDAPILVSPHNPKRLYFASQRVWKSEDRGDSWEAISGDLTNQIERLETSFYGKKQSWDNPWDVYAMSNYSTITSLSESPIKEGLIFIGTDDGLVQVTENGGESWRKISFSSFPNLPKTAFVNDIKTDQFNENNVFIVFDNHKFGDFNSYVYLSEDLGKSWKLISQEIPTNHICWRIVQDHENKNLLFLGTEFGLYVSLNYGTNWTKIKGGLPTIPIRDLAIQKRENDLVLATFGRGFYILDDYSFLRDLNTENLNLKSYVFKPRNGYWYNPKNIIGGGKVASQGDNYFTANNPPFGVEFTIYLKDKKYSLKEQRKQEEKNKLENNEEVNFPGWTAIEKEKNEDEATFSLHIMNADNQIIQKIAVSNSKGLQRVNWDLKTLGFEAITEKNRKTISTGPMAFPGNYYATLHLMENGKSQSISDTILFELKSYHQGYLDSQKYELIEAYWKKFENLRSKIVALKTTFSNSNKQFEMICKAYSQANVVNEEITNQINLIKRELANLDKNINGSSAREEVGEKNEYPNMQDYLWSAYNSSTSYGPTITQEKTLNIVQELYNQNKIKLEQIQNEYLNNLEVNLQKIGIPWIEGQSLPE